MAKHTQTIRQLLPTYYLSVFDHFVGFMFKELMNFASNGGIFVRWVNISKVTPT